MIGFGIVAALFSKGTLAKLLDPVVIVPVLVMASFGAGYWVKANSAADQRRLDALQSRLERAEADASSKAVANDALRKWADAIVVEVADQKAAFDEYIAENAKRPPADRCIRAPADAARLRRLQRHRP
jgi:hypothetical protein